MGGAEECPPCEGDVIGVSIFTDLFFSETSYQIKDDCNDDILWSRPQGSFTSPDTLYNETVCTPSTGLEYTFTIFDSYGDGICCFWGGGFYEVTFNGELKASGGAFGSSESTTFGSCSTDAPTPSPVTCVDADLLVPFNGNLFSCATIVNIGACSNPLAPTHCPLGCGECNTYQCEDSEAPWVVGTGTYNCPLLAAQEPDDITFYCNTFGLTTTCRETCGYCLG